MNPEPLAHLVGAEMVPQVQAAIQQIKLQSLLEIERFVISGAIPWELGIWMEEPAVDVCYGSIVVSERMRIL
jgi:hypothetical protein